MIYDIIGDIHGQAGLLIHLLEKLGYRRDKNGVFGHPERKAIFVGDIINKGPEIQKTVRIVRRMVEAQTAECILGNHEWAWISGQNTSIRDTVDSYRGAEQQFHEDLDWLRTLPLWIEKERLLVVHAFWHEPSIRFLEQLMLEERKWHRFEPGSRAEKAAQLLVNGPFYQLSPDERVTQNGRPKSRLRLRWWNLDTALTGTNEKPLFVGHYCLEGKARIAHGRICCLDTCVHRTGQLTAYSWQGEEILSEEHLLTCTA